MKNETLQTIQTRLVQYFVTNVRNINLLGVNSKDLSESFCLMVTKFFFTTMSLSSLIWYVFMFLSLRSVANWRWVIMLTVLWSERTVTHRNGTLGMWVVTRQNGMYGMQAGWLIRLECMVCGWLTHCNGTHGMRVADSPETVRYACGHADSWEMECNTLCKTTPTWLTDRVYLPCA